MASELQSKDNQNNQDPLTSDKDVQKQDQQKTKKRKFGFSDPVIDPSGILREMHHGDKLFTKKSCNFVLVGDSLTKEQNDYFDKLFTNNLSKLFTKNL
jgi:hypothetical protein